MARERGAPTGGQQREDVAQPLGESTKAEEVDARSGQFDRQRNAIEPAADLDDNRHVGIRQDKAVKAGDRPLDEQIDRRKAERVGRRQGGRSNRKLQRRQAADKFTFGAQRLAAGRQDMHPGRIGEHRFGKRGDGIDKVLAIVEQQQHLPLAQVNQQVRERVVREQLHVEGRGNRVGDQ